MTDTSASLEPVKGGRLTIARSRGAFSGLLLLLLGAWGALVPFFGPYFDFGYTPNSGFQWTEARGWFEVAPGAVAFLAGLVLIVSANRVVTTTAAWVAIAAGGWFVIGPEVSDQVNLGNLGAPIPAGPTVLSAEVIGLFTGVGAVIILVAAFALGRLSTRSVGDVRAAQKRRDRKARDEAAAAEAARVEDRDQTGRHDQYVADGRTDAGQPVNDGVVGNGVERNGVPRQEPARDQTSAGTTASQPNSATTEADRSDGTRSSDSVGQPSNDDAATRSSDDGDEPQHQISMEEMRRQHGISS